MTTDGVSFSPDTSTLKSPSVMGVMQRHLNAVVEEASKEGHRSVVSRLEEYREEWVIPPVLHGTDAEIPITPAAVQHLQDVAALFVKHCPQVRGRFETSVVRSLLHDAVGEAWPRDGGTLLDGGAVLEGWNRRAREAVSDAEWLIPCHVFDVEGAMAPIEVGPVVFWPRSAWLEHATQPMDKDDVRAVWARALPEEKLRDKAFSLDVPNTTFAAYEVAKVLGAHPWVASISIPQREAQRSERTAQILVEQALNIIGLFHGPYYASGLVSAGRERRAFRHQRLGFATNGQVLSGGTHQRPGIGGTAQQAADWLGRAHEGLTAAGALLSAYLNATADDAVPRLLGRWMDALYWFGLAAREPLDFMAVVSHGCGLDVIADAGGNPSHLVKFVSDVLGVAASGRLTKGGDTVKQAVEQVYKEGRSRLAHGTTPSLLADFGDTRVLGHDLLRYVLLRVSRSLSDMVAEDDPALRGLKGRDVGALMARVRARRGGAASDTAPF